MPKIVPVSSAPYINTQQLPTTVRDEPQKYSGCSTMWHWFLSPFGTLRMSSEWFYFQNSYLGKSLYCYDDRSICQKQSANRNVCIIGILLVNLRLVSVFAGRHSFNRHVFCTHSENRWCTQQAFIEKAGKCLVCEIVKMTKWYTFCYILVALTAAGVGYFSIRT